MNDSGYHYTECGLENIYLTNGFKFINTARGKAVSINNIDGLHKAIGLYLVKFKKDLSAQDIIFLRHEMLMSQKTLAQLLGVSEQSIHRWEKKKSAIPKPSELLLRLIYRENVHNQDGEISRMLKEIANLEDQLNGRDIFFKDTSKGWQAAS